MDAHIIFTVIAISQELDKPFTVHIVTVAFAVAG